MVDARELLINPGQYIVVTRIADGRHIGAGLCRKATATAAHYNGKSFSRATGIGRGQFKHLRIDPVEQEDAERITREISEREIADRDARYAAEEAKSRAAYEALPESIKLARSLKWLCDCESEAKISGAPIEAMRSIIEWAKANNLTTE